MKTCKKFLFGLLAAALLATSAAARPVPVAELEPAPVLYKDVRADAWYVEPAYYCLAQGLMGGTSTEELVFEPYTDMTRAMLATILYRLAGEPDVSGLENPYTDVVRELWYGPAVLWCCSTGYMEGYGGGLFGPRDTVDRQQIVAALWRMAGSPAPGGTAEPYADQGDIEPWALDAAAWSRENGIFPDRGAVNFYPASVIPRCEIAPTLMNFQLYRDPIPPEQLPDTWVPEAPADSEKPSTRNEAVWQEFEARFGYMPEPGARAAHTYIREGLAVAENAAGYDYMAYREGPYTLGVDVSAWQKDVDWQAVAASGVQFAMIRVGFRGYTAGNLNLDDYFVQNVEGALDAGLEVGVYMFCQSVNVAEAVEEANFVLDAIRGYDVTFPVVFDWERQDKAGSRTRYTDDDTIVACALAFCRTVEEAGYLPCFYGSRNKLNRLEMGYLADYPCWLAHYTMTRDASNYEGAYDMWQYSSSWTVPGVKGKCDVNICLTDWSDWR